MFSKTRESVKRVCMADRFLYKEVQQVFQNWLRSINLVLVFRS